MKWPWNAPETPEPELNETDSARLRRLEATLNDLDADVEILLKTIPKINAKLRQRAVREAEDNGAEPEELEPARPQTFRSISRDELVARAKAKGLR